jgi:hypothetical protein
MFMSVCVCVCVCVCVAIFLQGVFIYRTIYDHIVRRFIFFGLLCKNGKLKSS